jgi:hypothetical protein
MKVEDLTDIEFCDLLRKCVERLENEGSHATIIEGSFSDCIILIDRDEEINSQIPNKKQWFDLKLTILPQKIIRL